MFYCLACKTLKMAYKELPKKDNASAMCSLGATGFDHNSISEISLLFPWLLGAIVGFTHRIADTSIICSVMEMKSVSQLCMLRVFMVCMINFG